MSKIYARQQCYRLKHLARVDPIQRYQSRPGRIFRPKTRHCAPNCLRDKRLPSSETPETKVDWKISERAHMVRVAYGAELIVGSTKSRHTRRAL